MNHFKPTRLQTFSFIASMPIIDFLLNYIIYDERVFQELRIWLVSFPVIYAIGVLSWSMHVVITHIIRQKYPGLKHASTRVALIALCVLFPSCRSACWLFFLYMICSTFLATL